MANSNLPASLISAAKAGDQVAIVALLQQSQPLIRRYARRACRITDIDDATQEALWQLHRKIGGLRSVMAFSGWLFQVVRRACLRLMRNAGVIGDELGLIENSLAFSTRSDAEIRLDLAAAIQSLPAHYRNIVLLRDLEELTIDEISATLELSREAVKARLHRARKLLREYLSDANWV